MRSHHPRKSQNSPRFPRSVLWAVLLVDGILGAVFLMSPAEIVMGAGALPLPLGAIRWVGGWLCGIAIGAWVVRRSPLAERGWLATVAWSHILSGSALLAGFFNHEHTADSTVVGSAGGVFLVIGALLVLTQWRTRRHTTDAHRGGLPTQIPGGGAMLGHPVPQGRGR